jgi:uncharacterized protein (DUF1778 family)
MATISDDISLHFSLTGDQRKLVEAAAALTAQSLNAFAAAAVLETARRTVDGQRGIRLSESDRDHFLALLDNPPEPGRRLARAAEQHAENIIP